MELADKPTDFFPHQISASKFRQSRMQEKSCCLPEFILETKSRDEGSELVLDQNAKSQLQKVEPMCK